MGHDVLDEGLGAGAARQVRHLDQGAAGDGLALTLLIEETEAGKWVTDAMGEAGPLLPGEAPKIGRYALLAGGATLPFEITDPARDLALRLRATAQGWRLDA